MLIGSSKFAFAVFSFFIFISFPLLLWLFVPVYDVISEIVIDACFRYGDLSMHWHQPQIGKETVREREKRLDWQPIKIEFIAKFIVSLSIFYWTISPNCNLSHSFQLVSTWFGHFMLSCCDETFLALWCCHKSRRFPPVLHFHCSDACREFVFHYFSSSLPNMPSLLMRWEFGKLTMW